jgi:hypothetical protein
MSVHLKKLVSCADEWVSSKNEFAYSLETHCCVSGLEALLPCELARLEACGRFTREILSSYLTAQVWIASADAAAQRSRLILPSRLLVTLPYSELKSMLGNLRLACGGLHSSCSLRSNDEVRAVSCACSRAVTRNQALSSQPLRVIVGRLHFDLEDILSVLVDGSNEDLLCFSSELAFWWPGNGSRDRDTKLVAAIGCREGCNVLEICREGMHAHAPTLNIDVQVVIQGKSEFTSAGIEVSVDTSVPFSLPGFDLKDDGIREALVSPEGVLCILTVCGPFSAATSGILSQKSASVPQVKTSAINALALTPPYHASP